MSGLTFSTWPDEVIDKLGYSACDPYVERYWLPVLGPSQILLLRKVARDILVADGNPVTYGSDVQLAQCLGLGGNVSSLLRTLKRLEQFDMLAPVSAVGLFRIRTTLPPLARRQLARLPEYLAACCVAEERVTT